MLNRCVTSCLFSYSRLLDLYAFEQICKLKWYFSTNDLLTYTFSYIFLYAFSNKSRGHSHENKITASNLLGNVYKSRSQPYERMQHVTDMFENTILSSKTYNHDASCTKTYQYFKIFPKKYQSRGHLYGKIIVTCKPIRKYTPGIYLSLIHI